MLKTCQRKTNSRVLHEIEGSSDFLLMRVRLPLDPHGLERHPFAPDLQPHLSLQVRVVHLKKTVGTTGARRNCQIYWPKLEVGETYRV